MPRIPFISLRLVALWHCMSLSSIGFAAINVTDTVDNVDQKVTLASSHSSDYSAYNMPMVPSGRYLYFCGYGFIKYDQSAGLMTAVCGSSKKRYSLKLTDVDNCVKNHRDITWDSSNGLKCSKLTANTRMIGNSAIPDGDYLDSCGGVLLDNDIRTIYATCKKGDSDFKVSSLTLDECDKGETIANLDGTLVCASASGASSHSIPLGSYLNSCLARNTTFDKQSGTLTTLYHQSLSKQRECSGTCCSWNVHEISYQHDLFDSSSSDIARCQAQGLNICLDDEHTLFCSRFLPDNLFVELTASGKILPGPYLQYCNRIYYDEKHDILNAACAAHEKPSAVLNVLPMFADNVFEDDAQWCSKYNTWTCGNETPRSAFFTNHRLVSSTMTSASKCVDANGISRIKVSTEGKLECPLKGNFEFKSLCGTPYSPVHSEHTTPSYILPLTSVAVNTVFAVGIAVVNTLCVCRIAGKCRLRDLPPPEYSTID